MDKQEAIQRIKNHIEHHQQKEPHTKGFPIYKALDMAIKALQQDIVKCGECKYYGEPIFNPSSKMKVCLNVKGLVKTTKDSYCGYGERADYEHTEIGETEEYREDK